MRACLCVCACTVPAVMVNTPECVFVDQAGSTEQRCVGCGQMFFMHQQMQHIASDIACCMCKVCV